MVLAVHGGGWRLPEDDFRFQSQVHAYLQEPTSSKWWRKSMKKSKANLWTPLRRLTALHSQLTFGRALQQTHTWEWRVTFLGRIGKWSPTAWQQCSLEERHCVSGLRMWLPNFTFDHRKSKLLVMDNSAKLLFFLTAQQEGETWWCRCTGTGRLESLLDVMYSHPALLRRALFPWQNRYKVVKLSPNCLSVFFSFWRFHKITHVIFQRQTGGNKLGSYLSNSQKNDETIFFVRNVGNGSPLISTSYPTKVVRLTNGGCREFSQLDRKTVALYLVFLVQCVFTDM